MKKFLVMLLAFAVLLSVSGIAFAYEEEEGAEIDGNIYKSIVFDNEANATSGYADAYGNQAETDIIDTSLCADADDGCDAEAINDVKKVVKNEGTAEAKSGEVCALNEANNKEEETIKDEAKADADCEIRKCEDNHEPCYVDADLDGYCDICGCLEDACECECCPAEIEGDIDIAVTFDNSAYATSGDAFASGNESITSIYGNFATALADDGGFAKNTETIEVCNNGNADAKTGNANATNISTNNLFIDICRTATTSKIIDLSINCCSH